MSLIKHRSHKIDPEYFVIDLSHRRLTLPEEKWSITPVQAGCAILIATTILTGLVIGLILHFHR